MTSLLIRPLSSPHLTIARDEINGYWRTITTYPHPPKNHLQWLMQLANLQKDILLENISPSWAWTTDASLDGFGAFLEFHACYSSSDLFQVTSSHKTTWNGGRVNAHRHFATCVTRGSIAIILKDTSTIILKLTVSL